MSHFGFIGSVTSSGGDWVIYLLLAASILAVTVIIERALVISRRAREQGNTMDCFAALSDASIEHVRRGLPQNSIMARIAVEVQSHAAKGLPIMEQQLGTRLAFERNILEKRLLLLATLGNNAPFIGLLGTVLGVIRAFHDLGSAAGQGPEVVMQGLAEALISTAIGILVALPCVGSYNYLQKRIDDLMLEADRFGHTLIAMSASEL